MLVLHYTGMENSTAALKRLCRTGTDVSAHYVVLENGRIVQCVPETRRAWHAGHAFWAGETDINSCSIGIEIANPGHDYGYPDFPAPSDRGSDALCRSIFTRHRIPGRPRACPFRHLAGAQAAIRARSFPGAFCTDSGIGLWVKPAPIAPSGPLYRAWRHERGGGRGASAVGRATAMASAARAISTAPPMMRWRPSSVTSARSESRRRARRLDGRDRSRPCSRRRADAIALEYDAGIAQVLVAVDQVDLTHRDLPAVSLARPNDGRTSPTESAPRRGEIR